MHWIQLLRQWIRKVCADEGILGVASVYRVAGKYWMVAKVFHLVLTEPAITIDASHPGDPNARPDGRVRSRTVDNLSNNLMPRNKPWPHLRQVAFDDVQVRTADSARNHPKK
jgi:hypothetical protein